MGLFSEVTENVVVVRVLLAFKTGQNIVELLSFKKQGLFDWWNFYRSDICRQEVSDESMLRSWKIERKREECVKTADSKNVTETWEKSETR